MGRTRDTSNQERDRRICLYRRNGFTYSEIADLEDLSRARVAQIVAQTNVELGEDDGRAELATLLEFAERKCIQLINDPGGVPGPNGRLVVDEDGAPVPNNGIMVDAIKTLMVVEDRKAKLFALDKQQKKPETPLEQALREMHAHLAGEKARMEMSTAERRELEAFRQQAADAIPGEVVRELPPGQEPG